MRKSYLSIDKLYNTSGDAGILSGKIQKFHKKKWALKKQYSRETFPLQNIKQNNFLYPIRLNYKTRLKAKQLVKYFYNNLSNRQLKKEFLLDEKRIKSADNTSGILQRLETRIDVLLVRCNISNSLFEARQLINHGYFCVNSKIVKDKNISIKIGDIISVRNKYRANVLKRMPKSIDITPPYVEIDFKYINITLVDQPSVDNIFLTKNLDLESTSLFFR